MGNIEVQGGIKRAAEPSPILDLKNPSRSQRLGKIIVRGIKCKCGKSWCRVCSVKTVIKRFYEYVQGWEWQRVRELVLTVDRDKFENPEQAYTYLTKKKKIAGMIRNLERTQGIVVADWCWLIEWHKDGFPHWHVFVLVDKAGQKGQIGYKKILQYWEYGKIVEGYIHSQNHWEYLTGYFKKHGYFEKKKAHQARLPEWARNRKEVIRRFSRKGSKRSIKSEESGGDGSGNEINESIALCLSGERA